MEDCPWARAHSAGSWQSHWHGNGALQQRMLRVQQKGMQEQQDDEEASALSPTHTHLPLAGPSNPYAISGQNARLSKRNALDVEYMDYLPPSKRPHAGYTRSKPSVRSTDKHSQTGPAKPRPLEQGSSRFFTRAPVQPTQTVSHDFPPLCFPSPIRLPPHPPVAPLLLPAITHKSPAKSDYNTNVQSGLPHPFAARKLHQWTQYKAEFADGDLDLEFSGDEQEEQEAWEEMSSTTSNPRRNNEDPDKTEPDTDTDRDGSDISDNSPPDYSQIGMDTEDYALPWRRGLLAILSPPSDEHLTSLIQRGNESQLLVPEGQSTGNLNLPASAELPPFGLCHQPEVGPSQRVDLFTRRVEAIGPLAQRELEMDAETSVVPDSQDDISLLG